MSAYKNIKKAALITGAAKRVGRVIALKLAEAGYDIAISYHNSKQEAQELRQEIIATGVGAEIFPANLLDIERVKTLVSEVKQAFPHLCLLINNASVFERASFKETTVSFLEQHLVTNFTAPFFLTQKFAEIVEKGHVINIVDSHIKYNETPFFAYLLSKKLLASFTEMAAVALAPNITVNAISPGILLPSGPGFEEEYMQRKANKNPLKKLATPADIAQAILSLLALPVTGQNIFVDGGAALQ
jgi:NAD(P)-dependent dehydrogenase (short-subunit alcohol dehydrogenase family)